MTHSTIALFLLALGATAPASIAGPLTPPPGPVNSTSLPLAEAEPRTPISVANTPGDADAVFVISTPGSYFLTSNIAADTGRSAIKVAASRVTIDLRGFLVSGVPGSVHGVSIATGGDIRIQNGHLANTPGFGINGGSGTAISVDNVTCVNAAMGGIRVGNASVVSNCHVQSAGPEGGISVGIASIIDACRVTNGAGSGVVADWNTLVTRSTSFANAGAGFDMQSRSTIIGCAARANAQSGIRASAGVVVRGCNSNSNLGAGIEANNSALIRDNLCRENDVGITLSGADSRVEGNHLLGNAFGVRSITGGNLIIANALSLNATDFDLGGVDTIGPTIPPGPITSTSPWANFSF
ncbi:MAG: right-handed parallel beta-helix repeat-containing protein [Planctomycetota bacterium]